MKKEQLEIINENDEVIGLESRKLKEFLDLFDEGQKILALNK